MLLFALIAGACILVGLVTFMPGDHETFDERYLREISREVRRK